MSLELRTFLGDISLTKRPFLIQNGRAYTLHKLPSKRQIDAFYYSGHSYSVEEGETLLELELELLESNGRKIENFIKLTGEEYCRSRIKTIDIGIEELRDHCVETSQNKLEAFLREKFFSAYYPSTEADRGNEAQAADTPSLHFIIQEPSIGSIQPRMSCLEDIIGNESLLVIDGRCYYLQDASLIIPFSIREFIRIKVFSAQLPKGNYAKHGDSAFKVAYFCSTDELERRYRDRIKGQIIQEAIEYGESLYQALLSYKEHELDGLRKINDENKKKSMWDIRFEQSDQNTYRLHLNIRPYVMKKGGYYYFFDKPVKVGFDIFFEDNSLQILSPPFVMDMPYTHPFVWSGDGKICFGQLQWSDWQINFQARYSIDDKKTPFLLVRLLNEAERVLTMGYIGSPSLANSLWKNDVVKIDAEAEAVKAARLKNILPERIYDNDRTTPNI